MTCEEAGCYEAAIISIRKDPFGKSDAMRHLCSHHAPRWLAVSGQVNEKAIGGSDVCHTCAAHVKVITEDLEPRIRALEAELAVEKMQHSVTIADEHESRSEFQDRIRALEAERDDVVEARGEMARENVRLATELAEWRELYEFGLKDRNELLARAQTAEAYAARNALRVIELEASGNDLRASLVGMCHINDVMPDSVAERVKRFDDLFVTVPETACDSRCAFDTNNGDRCVLPNGHEGNHSL